MIVPPTITWTRALLSSCCSFNIGQAREGKLLVAKAARECQIIRLGKVECGPHPDRQIIPGKNRVELSPIQRTEALS